MKSMIIPPIISRLLIDVALIRDVHRARGGGERRAEATAPSKSQI
jgi:hypothetical protein